MVYTAPMLGDQEHEALRVIETMQRDLRGRVAEPRRWLGNLRRQEFARAVQGSNSIEGYNASIEDVMAAVDDEEPVDADEETVLALQGYRDAMTYVLQLADADEGPRIDKTLVLALHYMMLKHDLRKRPGRWRKGAIFVRREPEGDTVYEGPDVEVVDGLMDELVLNIQEEAEPPLVRAAMAHLNLVMIHPFADGNGRMARCLQTLVLACDRIVAPVFSSIEEYLGAHTQAYYEVLGRVGGGGWHPEHDARPWLRFCLNAHYHQMATVIRRTQEAEALWDRCEAMVARFRLPGRVVPALWEGARGFRIRNSSYRKVLRDGAGVEMEPMAASHDLRLLVDRGLLLPRGERRGRWYVGSEALRAEYAAVRAQTPRPARIELFPEPDQLSFLARTAASAEGR